MLTNCVLISRTKQIIRFRNDKETQENVWITMCVSKLHLYLLHLITWIIVWGHDRELGLYLLSRVDPSLLKQTPGWSEMHRFSRLYLLELCLSDCYLLVLVFRFVFAQLFHTRLQYFCIGIIKFFWRPNFSKSRTLRAFQFGLNLNCKLILHFIQPIWRYHAFLNSDDLLHGPDPFLNASVISLLNWWVCSEFSSLF